MTALPALDTAETAVDGGRYLSTWEAAVLGLPATSVVIPASTVTLQGHVKQIPFDVGQIEHQHEQPLVNMGLAE